jgi:methionyl-tRNA synthetase
MGSYFLTTAIDYANAKPHLGHAYEKVLADVIARHHRACGDDVFFLTGTDEHGQKIQQSAEKAGSEPRAFVDGISAEFQALCAKLNITHDRFVRTTEAGHQQQVRAWLQQLFDAGLIYRAEYEGYYSVRQEQFVTEKEMVDGQWPEIYGEVTQISESNYYFRLSRYQDWLKRYVEEHADWIVPAFRRQDVLAFLERPLADLCISRPKARLSWGIPLPFDEDFVTYVWFDALSNYATFATDGQGKNRWPADLHIIGKDILVPAHAIYWPCMLEALGMPQPKQFLVHGWWQVRGEKMSKSTGNVVNPLDLIEVYGVDAFRYFVMREMSVGYDADFTPEQFASRYNADLANTLGNLVNRSISMLNRYRQGVVPSVPVAEELASAIAETVAVYRTKMDAFDSHAALEQVWKLAYRGNQYVDETAPWKLAKDPEKSGALDTVLATLAETVRVLSVLVSAVMPTIAGKIQGQLGLTEPQTALAQAACGTSLQGTTVGQAEPLFPRVETAAPTPPTPKAT